MFVTARKNAHPLAVDVSRYGPQGWRRLSPFHTYPAPCIPVPGTFDTLDVLQDSVLESSRSVEGIWQGLKVIEGEQEPDLFERAPRKRRGRPEGHWFGYRLLGYAEAKALIYIPTFLHVLCTLEREVVAALRVLGNHDEIALVDVSYQPDCLGPKPISHAALLVDYLEGHLLPYELARQRLESWAARLGELYGQSEAFVVGHIADELSARVLSMTFGPPDTYENCALLWERESLMLSLVRNAGSAEDIDPARQVLTRWIEAGLLTHEQARALGQLAPVNRWGFDLC